MGNTTLRNARKIFTGSGGDLSLPNRVLNLENNEYKITYYEIVSGASGSLTIPAGATINTGEFELSGNCVLSKIDGSNKPTFESPKTSGGTVVTASLNENTGAWVASGAYTDATVALLYSIKTKAVNYSNLTYNNIIETVEIDNYKPIVQSESFTATNGLTYHAVATLAVTDPTPIEGQGFDVLVLNGAATVGGVAYSIKGTLIKRVYEGGVWANYTYFNSQVLDISLISTIRGFSSYTDRQIYLHLNGNSATVSWRLEGPGTGTDVDFTILVTSITTSSNTTLSINNGAAATVGRSIIVLGTSIVLLSQNTAGGNYSGAGNRRSTGSLTFVI